MGRKNDHYSIQQFLNAIPATGGVISDIAKAVGCSWNTAYKYIHKYKTIHRAWLDEKETLKDFARKNIRKAIVEDGDLKTSQWFLSMVEKEFQPRVRNENVDIDIDVTLLTNEQLSRIATGEDVFVVLSTTNEQNESDD